MKKNMSGHVWSIKNQFSDTDPSTNGLFQGRHYLAIEEEVRVMGTKCAPLVAYLFLFCYEKDITRVFFLLWYSVLFTVESLFLLHRLVISWFICSGRWCIDKLGVFHANKMSMCLDRHLNQVWGWHRKTSLSPPVKYFTYRSKAVLLLWIYLCFFLSCVCYAFVSVCLYVPCGHLLGKGWPLGSRSRYPTVSLSLSHWYSGSGVVLDCIDSWSLHPYLLLWCLFLMISRLILLMLLALHPDIWTIF